MPYYNVERMLCDRRFGDLHEARMSPQKPSLTLTHADSYFGWSKQPSRFLAEMGLHSGSMAC